MADDTPAADQEAIGINELSDEDFNAIMEAEVPADKQPAAEKMPDELLPCPFCGGKAKIRLHDDGCDIGCENNPCAGFRAYFAYMNDEDAIAAWNTRSDLAPSERAKELQFKLDNAIKSLVGTCACRFDDGDDPTRQCGYHQDLQAKVKELEAEVARWRKTHSAGDYNPDYCAASEALAECLAQATRYRTALEEIAFGDIFDIRMKEIASKALSQTQEGE